MKKHSPTYLLNFVNEDTHRNTCRAHRTCIYTILVFILCFCRQTSLAHCALAQTIPGSSPTAPILVLEAAQEYIILPKALILRDPSGTMTLDDVLKAAQTGRFLPPETENPRLYGKEALWIRFTLQNTKLMDWVLLAGNSRIDSVTLFTPNMPDMPANVPLAASDYMSSFAGELTPLSARAFPSKYPTVPLVISDNSSYTFYMRLRALYAPARPTLIVLPAEQFIMQERFWQTAAFVLLGMFLFAVVFNTVLFVIVRDTIYVWYILHVITLLLVTLLSATVIAEQSMFTPETLVLMNIVVLHSTFAVAFQFIRVFFNTRATMPRLYDVLLAGSALATVQMAIFVLLGWNELYWFCRNGVVIISSAVSLYVLIRAILTTSAFPTRVYGVMLAAFGLLKFGLVRFGVLHEPLITGAAGVVEIMLFSFALAARMTAMREQILQERQERKTAQKLREQEQIRNTELALANQEISRQNTILAEQSREIELTNTNLNETVLELDAALHDLKETQTQLVASERIAAVGLLTAGVMHEINNPNAAVYAALEQMKLTITMLRKFFLSLLDDADKQSPEAQKFFAIVEDLDNMTTIATEGSGRVKHIVASLRSFAKHQESGIKRASLEKELASTVEMFRYQFKNTDVTLQFDGDSTIKVNFSEINQVILNLLVNAAQADATHITIHGEENGDKTVVNLDVSDNGRGIPPEVLTQMFEPFYTTKGAGNSGLGLSISKKILEQHDASLHVDSTIGKGTTFSIQFRRT